MDSKTKYMNLDISFIKHPFQRYKMKKSTYKELTNRIKTQEELINLQRRDIQSYLMGIEKLKKENQDRIFEKHHDEISKILQSLASVNESVSKAILSINNHL